jgi:uncharacterized membrane protein
MTAGMMEDDMMKRRAVAAALVAALSLPVAVQAQSAESEKGGSLTAKKSSIDR